MRNRCTLANRMGFFVALAAMVALSVLADNRTDDLISEKRSEEPWTKEPSTYRDVPFGAPEGDVIAKLGKLKCRAYSQPFAHRSCTLADKTRRLRIGDAVMSESFDFLNGKLEQIEIRDGSSSGWSIPAYAGFSITRDAFVERYGAPTLDQTFRVKGSRTIKNRSGGVLGVEPYEFKRSMLTWEGRNLQVVVGGSIDGDALYVARILTTAWTDATNSEKKKQTVTDF